MTIYFTKIKQLTITLKHNAVIIMHHPSTMWIFEEYTIISSSSEFWGCTAFRNAIYFKDIAKIECYLDDANIEWRALFTFDCNKWEGIIEPDQVKNTIISEIENIEEIIG